ncbi:unnamed protein product [Allacma fusca]|uniref:Uncharacterized protein n=1 Tax=Allacma fusca TaxID=39272 RepID=A0A8J2KGZ3_9HEXA|nr:unnamed protein product [Allacma fusca]
MAIAPFTVLFWIHVAITIINALQGVGLFWGFVLQKKIKNQLKEKFCNNLKRENTKSTAVSWTARTDSTDFSTTNNAL